MAEENWDLQAVVRGYVGGVKTSTAESSPMSRNPPSYLQSSSSPSLVLCHEDIVDDTLLFGYQDLLTKQITLQELHDHCKPFPPRAPSRLPSSQQLKQNKILPFPSLTPRPRKRKSQQVKKMVCHVPADDNSDHMWAWRKYGQKPIKGSPFPRGYYRCSSTKSCVARKQVERSRTDPGMYVITYTGEHNHPPPTHRNSLSGSTRKKLVSLPATNDAAKSTTAEVGGGLSTNTAYGADGGGR